MRLEEAIDQLDAMTAVADRASTFDGLRAAPIAATGLVGVVSACLQPHFVGDGDQATADFALLWIISATFCISIVLGDMWLRYRREPTRRTRRLTLQVLGRLAPAMMTGTGVTLVVLRHAPEIGWTLPAWWSILLGTGICSALSLLPRSVRPVGAWYLGSGLLALMVAQGSWALHPLSMAIPFCGGQFLTAFLITRDRA